VGNITTKNGQVVYSVKSIVDINSIIIPHFDKYPLLHLRIELFHGQGPTLLFALARAYSTFVLRFIQIRMPRKVPRTLPRTVPRTKQMLLTQKQADFLLFKKIVELVIQKHHLREEGLINILEFKASLNKGLSPELEKAFPDVIPVARAIVQLPVNLDTN
jgi:hypothetical protein